MILPSPRGVKVCSKRHRERTQTYHIHVGEEMDEGYRILWVHGEAKEVLDRKAGEKRIKKAEQALVALSSGLNQRLLKTREQIEQAAPVPVRAIRKKRSSTTSWSGSATRRKFATGSAAMDYFHWRTIHPWIRLMFCAPTRISPTWRNALALINQYWKLRRYF